MTTRVIHGDCLRILPEIPSASIDAIVTDPPYGIAYRNKRDETVANDHAPFIWFLPEAYRVLKPGTAILVFCRWDVQEAFRLGLELAGFRVRSQIVWDRGVHGMGDTAAQFAPQHDVVWFATKGRFRFPGGRPTSVLREMRVAAQAMVHPTEKPVGLLRRLVASVTRPGDTVLDPFAGSGSTGEGALLEGRSFLGMEIDPIHAGTAERRCLGALEIASLFPRRLDWSGRGNAYEESSRSPPSPRDRHRAGPGLGPRAVRPIDRPRHQG